jgi:precorrin-2/cobalt-factor-2 C20-methyltransferase
MSGTVYGIGVGPGDPELITLKGLRLLRACPVVAYPAPEGGESLARRIVASHLPGGQSEIVIGVPMTGEKDPAAAIYDRAAAEIAGHLTAGRDVAVLCLGDPFFYGSFMYLFERLAGTHKVVVVPGVTSISAASAALGLPLAARNESFAVIPAGLDDAEIEQRLAACDSAAILKLGKHLSRIRALVARLGLEARYIERASMAEERRLTLADVDPASAPYFSLLLVRRRA